MGSSFQDTSGPPAIVVAFVQLSGTGGEGYGRFDPAIRQPDPFGEGGKLMKTVLRSDSWGMDDGYPFLIELW